MVQTLKALVVFMGILIILGTVGLGYAIVQRSQKTAPVVAEGPVVVPPVPGSASAGSASAGPTSAAFGEVDLALPAGASIVETTANGNRLVLRLVLPDETQRILVVDLETGRPLGTLRIATNP